MKHWTIASAVVALATEIGVPFCKITEALESFRGAKRRFEIKLQTEAYTVVDDYGHHPTEICATLRAARLGCHLLPQGPRDEVLEPWRRTLALSGRDPDAFRVGIIRACLVTDDPERDWPPVRAAERYRGQLYTRFFAEAGRHVSFAREGPRIPQTWVVGDVAHCVRELSAFIAEHGITDLVTWAVPPGLHPQQMNASLERFAREVMPQLR